MGIFDRIEQKAKSAASSVSSTVQGAASHPLDTAEKVATETPGTWLYYSVFGPVTVTARLATEVAADAAEVVAPDSAAARYAREAADVQDAIAGALQDHPVESLAIGGGIALIATGAAAPGGVALIGKASSSIATTEAQEAERAARQKAAQGAQRAGSAAVAPSPASEPVGFLAWLFSLVGLA